MKLSIIIPVYNEKDTILKLLKLVENVDLGNVEKEIIIVDDFSTDGTRELLFNIKQYKVILNQKNLGKGATVRWGFSKSTGDIIVVQDADLEYDPNDLKKLLDFLLKNNLSVVYGSRFLERNFKVYKNFLPHHYIGNKGLSLITSLLYGIKITDMETCYKMFRRVVLDKINLKANRFEFEPEITAKILKKGYKICEIPVNYNARDFFHGKKINWRDGIKAFYYIVKYRFFD